MLFSGIFLAVTSLALAVPHAVPAVTIFQLAQPAPSSTPPGEAAEDEMDREPIAPNTPSPAPPSGQDEGENTRTAVNVTAAAPAGNEAPANGAEQVNLVPPEAWDSYLDRARTVLSGVTTARGRFLQVNDDDSYIEGNFALRRPGRMRFDYDDPSPILIVADGATVAITDTDLETVDRVPLSSTPLHVLLDDRIDFGTEVETLRILEWSDQVAITVQSLSGEVEGMLTLLFDTRTDSLLGWRAIDTEGLSTQITLSDVETAVRLSPALFRLYESDDEEDER